MFHRCNLTVGILGFDFSEKAITYIFAAQVMFSAGLSSFIPTICGFFSSYILSSSLSRNDDIFPESLVKLCEKVGTYVGIFDYPSTFVHSASSSHNGNRQRRTSTSNRPVGGANAPRPENAVPMAPAMNTVPRPVIQPPSEAIETLTAMGFDREQVVRSL